MPRSSHPSLLLLLLLLLASTSTTTAASTTASTSVFNLLAALFCEVLCLIVDVMHAEVGLR